MPGETVEHWIAERYRVLGLVGQGGMGAVYRVRDQRDGSELALKQLAKSASENPFTAELFEREFHALSELAHPCIVEVFDYGLDPAGAYYTMELLGGQDLRALGKVDWRTACGLLRDVASSLAIVHSRRLLHGDLSPRNVRCTADGRAKLLDFGAMAPMGTTRRVVGTPPFIAPEMVQMQALDGRTDLYALGALGYWLLTGRHAYPAATVKQLRDRWRTPPVPPSAPEPEVPAALSELVMELLQLNRNARPRTAGAVMERLCAIAGLPLHEQADVAQAYLTTPALVGRDSQLATVRERMLAMQQGRGGTLLVRGPGGSGRSRFLDACVLEAKLLGAHVLRADRGDAESGAHGVAGSLCRQLLEIAPEAAQRAARLNGPVLAHALGVELAGVKPVVAVPDRRVLQLALRDFVLSVARSLRLVVAVDDVDRIDEASASLLTALAQKAPRRSLLLVLTMDAEGEGSAALDVLAERAHPLELPPLDEAQTEQLLGSVFGQARHTFTVARSVHAVARGNPRATMQLASHLVEQGIARYEAGGFVLPDQLLPEDLPQSLAAALARRVTALDADALELARILSLTDPSELPVASYVELTSHGDRGRTYRAIDQLVRIQMLEPQGERYRCADPNWRVALEQGLSKPERVALHARLARAFERDGTVSRRSHHLMESEQPEAAIRLILTQFLKDPNEPRDPLADYVPGMLDLLERAALAAEELQLPLSWQVELRMKVSGASQYLGDLERFKRVALPLLDLLEQESGLRDYLALDPNMDPAARLTETLTRLQQRYDSAPDQNRLLAPIDAIRELSRLCAMFIGMNTTAQEAQLLARIPSLEPYAPLSPAIQTIQKTVDASRAVFQGRDAVARELLLQLAERIAQPDGAGLGQLYAVSMRLGNLQAVGLMEASAGLPDAVRRVAEHEKTPGYRVNAYRVYMVCHLMQGDPEAAAIAQRRAELVMLQDGQPQRYPGSTLRSELYAHWLAGDAAGVKDVSERAARLAQQYPAWLPVVNIARCLHRHLTGDHEGALAALEPTLKVVRPLEQRDWAWAVACQVQVLAAMGRAAEAVELGLEAAAVCEREGLSGGRRVAQATAEALLAAGRPDEAAVLADRLIAQAKAQGVRGLVLGSLYELRAQAAGAAGDEAAHRRFAAECAAHYPLDRNPVLAARFRRLCRQPEPVEATTLAHEASDLTSNVSAALSVVHSRLYECSDDRSRARCALEILVEHVNAERGYLYGAREGRLSLLAGFPDAQPPLALPDALDRYLRGEIEQDKATVIEDPPDGVLPTRVSYTPSGVVGGSFRPIPPTPERDGALLEHRSGLRMFPVLLAVESAGERTIAGVAALAIRAQALPEFPSALVAALAAALLDHDDVDAMTCVV